jgi:hypothetical protein
MNPPIAYPFVHRASALSSVFRKCENQIADRNHDTRVDSVQSRNHNSFHLVCDVYASPRLHVNGEEFSSHFSLGPTGPHHRGQPSGVACHSQISEPGAMLETPAQNMRCSVPLEQQALLPASGSSRGCGVALPGCFCSTHASIVHIFNCGRSSEGSPRSRREGRSDRAHHD